MLESVCASYVLEYSESNTFSHQKRPENLRILFNIKNLTFVQQKKNLSFGIV